MLRQGLLLLNLCFLISGYENVLNGTSSAISTNSSLIYSSGLQCYYCTYSLRNSIKIPQMSKNHMHYCLTKSKLITDERLRTPCAIHEGQCMMVVQLVNGLITDIERDCVSSCSQQCFETGYGLTIKRCIRCCDTNLCNDFHIYDMDPLDVDPYKIKPSSGTTSSIPYFLYLLPLFSCCYLN